METKWVIDAAEDIVSVVASVAGVRSGGVQDVEEIWVEVITRTIATLHPMILQSL